MGVGGGGIIVLKIRMKECCQLNFNASVLNFVILSVLFTLIRTSLTVV